MDNIVNKIVKPHISLETPILPKDKLYPTPSMKDGLKYEDEFDLRVIGCELIQTSGRLLKLPQTAMATGQIIFHRYFYSKSFVKNNMEHYAMAAIYLSSKIEESPRTIRDVINVFNNIKQVRSGKIIEPMPINVAYHELKNNVIKAERRILKELGFCVHVKHPHKMILIYLSAMNCTDKELIQKAWNYMNDSLRTDVFLRYTPETVVCACIYLSARELKIPLPTKPQWFTIFGAEELALKSISVRLIHLYNHKPKSQEELEKTVNCCRDSLNQEKNKNKEIIQTQNAQINEESREQTTPAASIEIKTASTTPASDVSAPAVTITDNIKPSTNVTNKINVINNTSINVTNNITHHHHHHQHTNNNNNNHNHHHRHHHTENRHNYQQYQYQSNYHMDSQQQQHYYLNDYPENNLPFYKYNESVNGYKRKDITATSKSSHRKHSRHHSSITKSRSRSRSDTRSGSSSPKHKRHKKRSSKEKYRSKSRSRSTSPTKHKKKKTHHKSKSRDDNDSNYNYDSRYKNILV